jgi:hypothetical protein
VIVQLMTYSGPVGQADIPPFKKLPEVLVWGCRTFVLDIETSVTTYDGTPVYREGCAFTVVADLVREPVATGAGAAGKSPFPELDVEPVDRTQRESTSGRVVTTEGPAPDPETDATGQHKGYWVLSEEERAKGFVRPVRRKYRHVGIPGPRFPLRDLTAGEQERYAGCGYVKFEPYPESEAPVTGRYWTQQQLDKIGKGCGSDTTMGQAIAETYARDPEFYGATFCCACGSHFPVGKDGEFVWCGTHTNERVGT